MPEAALRYRAAIAGADLGQRRGRVLDFNGLVLEADGPDVFLGEACEIRPRHGHAAVAAEVVGFRQGRVMVMPYGDIHGISLDSTVVATGRALGIPVGPGLLGRVVDAFGRPLDGRGPIGFVAEYPLYRAPINPLARQQIDEVLETGVRAIDAMLTLGKGQRVGIFAGSGVGKSTLLGMLASHVRADVNVIALVGERGREVWDFIRGALGPEGLARSVVIVATSDEPALVRSHAVHAAHAVAEHFRDQKRDVLLIMDSITRFATAQREIGLAIGEPPTARGYTPSLFSVLPRLLERGGRLQGDGSVTAIYSVLVEGDDMNEPVADHMRALLDGHLVLTRELAARGHYPALDVLHSVSRLMPALAAPADLEAAQRARATLARYEASRDLIDMGAYRDGANEATDDAITRLPALERLLRQTASESATRADALAALHAALA